MSKKAALAHVLQKTGLGAVIGKVVPWSGVLVLNYHRVGDGRKSVYDRGLWSATNEDFVDQLRFCKANAEVIGASDLPRILKKGKGRYVLITFDDGYRDNYELAFPILKSEHIQATFFVTTGFLDDPRVPWWDEIAWMVRTSKNGSLLIPEWFPSPIVMDEPERELAIRTLLRKYKTLPEERTQDFVNAVGDSAGTGRHGAEAGRTFWMTWDMLREMKAAGMTIGGHTVTHPVLAKASQEKQRAEILGCGRRLAEELGESMKFFSYPVGGLEAFNGDTRACLREAGVLYAFSYYGGFRKFDEWDDYDIRRVAVETDLTTDVFRSMIQVPQVFA